jgi:hypothetical protein
MQNGIGNANVFPQQPNIAGQLAQIQAQLATIIANGQVITAIANRQIDQNEQLRSLTKKVEVLRVRSALFGGCLVTLAIGLIATIQAVRKR